MTIDAVIAWVDGEDPIHQAKREACVKRRKRGPSLRASHPRRFSDNGELRYCLRSLRQYAPWLDRIWIVTDSQQPQWLDLSTDRRIRIVDHKHIFRDHLDLLPTFNSLSIETFIWRIEGLSDQFLYLNDDMMLTSPCEPSTFFDCEGRPRLRGRWDCRAGGGRISFHSHNKIAAASMLGGGPSKFFSPGHVPYPLRRSMFEVLYARFPQAFRINARPRFRRRRQFWPIGLHDHALLECDGAIIDPGHDAFNFSVWLCKTATAAELAKRFDWVASGEVRMICLNYMEALEAKVPDLKARLDALTGPPGVWERDKRQLPTEWGSLSDDRATEGRHPGGKWA